MPTSLFTFIGDISHNTFNSVEMVDDDLLHFMIEFNTNGYLNNTLLIVLGDHGLRYGDFRQTVQGKLEERLPLFSMSFPKWFKDRYPMISKNLRKNTQRLTSWYDVYATFDHILEYPNEPKELKHGKSLLTEIPAERSCKDASIPEHWCPCMQWSVVDIKHEHILHAALAAVNYINDMIFKEPLGAERCSELSLQSLIRAEVERPTTRVLRFSGTGHDGYEAKYSSGKIQPKNRCSYQVTFTTLPSQGVFEASVHYLYGRFVVKGSISRVNKYGDQPKCIAYIIPHLREYCYCK